MNIKAIILSTALVLSGSTLFAQQDSDHKYQRPLKDVLMEISKRFNVRLKWTEVVVDGKMLDYADSRIRPYSVEESLNNVLVPFDYKFVKQGDNLYKIKNYEYARRTDEDGVKMIKYLNSLYPDSVQWNKRKECLRKEVRERLGIDPLLKARVNAKPVISKERIYSGYTVQNFSLETLPGLYVCGSIYKPLIKGKFPLIICPNGHFLDGRYRKDQQQRMATLARMGAICVDYDLFAWGESMLQFPEEAHHKSAAQVIQALNGISILDFMYNRKDVDKKRIGVNGGSGGGSQTVLLSVLDQRYTALCPVVSLSSHFDGGCPCESGLPVFYSCGGTVAAELAATNAPKPMLIVSDGQDWTSTVPTLEFPYIKRIYDFYGSADKVTNVHLPAEGHDFGPNKRNAVYNFFADAFNLKKQMLDESKVTIEPKENMYSFGDKGEKLPKNAMRSFEELEKLLNTLK